MQSRKNFLKGTLRSMRDLNAKVNSVLGKYDLRKHKDNAERFPASTASLLMMHCSSTESTTKSVESQLTYRKAGTLNS